MDRLKGITLVLAVSVCMIACKPVKRHDISIKDGHCKPCTGSSGNVKNRSCERVLKNDTFHVVKERLGPLLREIGDELKAETRLLADSFGADRNYKPFEIHDLRDIENSNISKYLRDGNPVEKIIHYSYGRIMLLISYFDMYKAALKESEYLEEVGRNTHVQTILEQLKELSCKLYSYTSMFGVRKIKKKVCMYDKSKIFDSWTDRDTYILSVLQLGNESFQQMHMDIESLDSDIVLGKCSYICKNDKRKLECEEDNTTKELRMSKRRKTRKQKGERRRKNKKNRKNKKQCNKKVSKKGNKKRCNKGKKNRKNGNKKSDRH